MAHLSVIVVVVAHAFPIIHPVRLRQVIAIIHAEVVGGEAVAGEVVAAPNLVVKLVLSLARLLSVALALDALQDMLLRVLAPIVALAV